jgi:hypothetical protein
VTKTKFQPPDDTHRPEAGGSRCQPMALSRNRLSSVPPKGNQ